MKKWIVSFLLSICFLSFYGQEKVRYPVDSIGFATKAWQMDSIMERIDRVYGSYLDSVNRSDRIKDAPFRLAICPHDDYTYAGFLYESVLSHIRARTVILLGVAHKAKKFRVEGKLVFDTFDEWQGPYGKVALSPLREEILKNLPEGDYILHDTLQQAEHSLEALIPFLQHQDPGVRIIPILVPYMDFEKMDTLSRALARSIYQVMKNHGLAWGKDLSLVISNDAVHYGDEEWGGQNYATYGCDSAGYRQAVNHEYEIIRESLLPVPDTSSIRKFFTYTIRPGNWHDYRWPWCGRYSVPFGLLTGMYLGRISGDPLSEGILTAYATSISHPPLPVEDLGMGKTAVATLHHWVGYAAVGYK